MNSPRIWLKTLNPCLVLTQRYTRCLLAHIEILRPDNAIFSDRTIPGPEPVSCDEMAMQGYRVNFENSSLQKIVQLEEHREFFIGVEVASQQLSPVSDPLSPMPNSVALVE